MAAMCLRGKTKCDCIRRCESGLSAFPELFEGCRAACLTDDPPADATDYLENYVGDDITIGYYGIDADPYSGGGIMGLPESQALILSNSTLLEPSEDSTLLYLGVGLGVLIAVGLMAYAFLKK